MNKGRMGFLTTTHTVNDLYQGAVPALLPFLMSQRGYSYSALAGISLAASGLSSVAQPLFGLLADRRPRTWLVPAGTAVAATGVAAAAMANSYAATWLCMAVAGIGIAAYHPPATSLARLAGGRSQRAMSAFSVGGTLGSSLAPVLVTVVVRTAGLSSGWLLALPAVLIIVMWVGRNAWVRRRRQADAAVAAVVPLSAPATTDTNADDDWQAFARLIAVTVCWSIPYVTVTSLVALHAQHSLGESATVGSFVLGSFTLAGAAGTLLGGWLGDRYRRLAPVRFGYLLGIPALAGVVFAPNLAVLVVSVVLAGTALFLPFAAQVTLAQDYLPRRPGTASGLTLGLAISVGGLSSPLFGWCADSYGLRAALGLSVAIYLGAVVVALQLPDHVPGLTDDAAGDRPALAMAITPPSPETAAVYDQDRSAEPLASESGWK